MPLTSKAHDVFNITALTPYKPNTFPDRITTPTPSVTMADGSQEFVVSKILGHRQVGRGRQYLTVYEGERDIDATWQPRTNFMDNGRVTSTTLLVYEQENHLA